MTTMMIMMVKMSSLVIPLEYQCVIDDHVKATFHTTCIKNLDQTLKRICSLEPKISNGKSKEEISRLSFIECGGKWILWRRNSIK